MILIYLCSLLTFFLLFSAKTALAQAGLLKDGKEYTYDSEIRVGTGTMDYAPHLAGGVWRMKTRIQATNGAKSMNVEVNVHSFNKDSF